MRYCSPVNRFEGILPRLFAIDACSPCASLDGRSVGLGFRSSDALIHIYRLLSAMTDILGIHFSYSPNHLLSLSSYPQSLQILLIKSQISQTIFTR